MNTSFPFAMTVFWILISAGCRSESEKMASGEPETGGSLRGAPVSPDDVVPGVWDRDPALRWSLEPDLRIGSVDGGGEDVFGRIRNLIPDGTGGVWVFDPQAYELRHFDADGRHMVSVGRRGEGPGEFSGGACALPGTDGEIWVETETNWHRFNAAGELLGTFPTPRRMACAVWAELPDGRFVAADGGFNWETEELQSFLVVLEWVNGTLAPVDTLPGPEVPEPETVTFVNASGRSHSTDYIPFSHPGGWRLEKDGRLWVWDGGGNFDIRLQSLNGDTIRRISRHYAPVRIDGKVRSKAIEDFTRPGWRAETHFDPSSVPRTYPPFSSARLAEDGSAWVQRQMGEVETSWEIFTADDRYLGVLEVPESLQGISLRHIGSDLAWGILRDDLDVQYVVRVRVVKPGG